MVLGDHSYCWMLKPCWDGWPVLWVDLVTCSRVVKKWMFNWSEFGHAWLKFNWMLRLHSGIMDNALDLSWIWLRHLVSVYLVFSLDSLHQSMSMNLAGASHGLATSTTALAGLTVGFTPRLLPGSNARWCVENWPLVSRLWLSFPVTQLCDCHLLWLTLVTVGTTRPLDSFWC